MFLSVLQEGATAPLSEVGSKADEWLELAKSYAVEYGPPLLAALLVLVLGRWISNLIVKLVRRVLARRGIDETLTRFLCSLLGMVLLALVVISALQTAGVETTSFVAVLGAATLAIGFALQGSLSNFAAGVMLIVFRPFKSGDYVDAGGTMGTVEEVGVFHTMLRTPDNRQIIVPNSSITSGNITNFSAKDTRRVDLVFGIAYDDDIRKAKEILQSLLDEDERVLADPAPMIAVGELGDSSVNLLCRPWCKSGDYWGLYWDLLERAKQRFDAAGVTIPFPQRDVHVHDVA